MGDSSASYMHMVSQHLIENCLIFRMGKEECMEALSKHADIKHVITYTGYWYWSDRKKEKSPAKKVVRRRIQQQGEHSL
ncbi:hypothetical protein UlMin_015923 [Ulmus minor]